MSVVDFGSLGSTLSLRSCARIGASLSVVDFGHVGSSLSLRSFARLSSGFLHTAASGFAKFGSDTTYIKYDTTPEVRFYAGGTRALTWTGTGTGTLHGTWSVDTDGGGFSDRRLKENITPLVETLRSSRKADEPGWDPQKENAGTVTEWLLRQIQPVAYAYKTSIAGGSSAAGESGTVPTRFGFIADEMKRVLPDITRDNVGGKSASGIVYQDLIAVLTYALQDLSATVGELGPRLAAIEERIRRRRELKRMKSAQHSARKAAVSPNTVSNIPEPASSRY